MGRKKVVEQVDPWIFENKKLTDLADCPEGSYGFVYLIESKISGKKYVGKKALHSYKTVISHEINPRTGRLNKVRNIVASESNWKDYFGSSVEVKELIKAEGGKNNFIRTILRFCFSKKELTFREIQEQCIRNVLEDSDYINSNIEGRYFRNEFVK